MLSDWITNAYTYMQKKTDKNYYYVIYWPTNVFFPCFHRTPVLELLYTKKTTPKYFHRSNYIVRKVLCFRPNYGGTKGAVDRLLCAFIQLLNKTRNLYCGFTVFFSIYKIGILKKFNF